MKAHPPDSREEFGVWPVVLTIARRAGWTLWFSGDVDVLLAADGNVVLLNSPQALEAFGGRRQDLIPQRLAGNLTQLTLRTLLADEPHLADVDQAQRWFTNPARGYGAAELSSVLDGVNILADIAASVGDVDLFDLVASAALAGALDEMTFRLTFLGESRPDDGSRLTSFEVGDAASSTLALAVAQAEVDCAFLPTAS